MFSFIVYYDQLFSCQYNGPLNVELINTKFFDDYSKGSLLFQKESTNPSKEFSKIKYIENKTPNYIRMRPSFDKKGNILIIPAIDFSGSNSSSRSSIKLPSAPKPTNLSTPSIMSPLFNSEISNSSPRKSHTVINMSTNQNSSSSNSTTLADIRTSRENDFVKKNISNPRDLRYSDIKREIIKDIQTNIKEAEVIKGAETVIKAEVFKEKVKKTPFSRILSASK
jgi:hypothetical protein